jgi:hypothetical protein
VRAFRVVSASEADEDPPDAVSFATLGAAVEVGGEALTERFVGALLDVLEGKAVESALLGLLGLAGGEAVASLRVRCILSCRSFCCGLPGSMRSCRRGSGAFDAPERIGLGRTAQRTGRGRRAVSAATWHEQAVALKMAAKVLMEGRSMPGWERSRTARSLFGPQRGRSLRAATMASSRAIAVALGLLCGRRERSVSSQPAGNR